MCSELLADFLPVFSQILRSTRALFVFFNFKTYVYSFNASDLFSHIQTVFNSSQYYVFCFGHYANSLGRYPVLKYLFGKLIFTCKIEIRTPHKCNWWLVRLFWCPSSQTLLVTLSLFYKSEEILASGSNFRLVCITLKQRGIFWSNKAQLWCGHKPRYQQEIN